MPSIPTLLLPYRCHIVSQHCEHRRDDNNSAGGGGGGTAAWVVVCRQQSPPPKTTHRNGRRRHTLPFSNGGGTILLPFVSLLITVVVVLMTVPISVTALAGASSGKKRSVVGSGFSKPPPLTYQPDTSPTTRRLVQVLTEKGAMLEGTEIGWCRSTTTGSNRPQRGLFATRNFKTDQVICKIPSAWVLALSDPNSSENDDSTTTSSSNMAQLGVNFLTMYYQNPTASAQWSFYFDSLPLQTLDDDDATDINDVNIPFLERTPDWYSSEELALLEFPRCITVARQRQADIDHILRQAQNGNIRRDVLHWATTLVSTRSFGLAMAPLSDSASASATESDDAQAAPQLDDRGQVITPTGERTILRVLIPYLDMVNHVSLPKANAQWTVLDPDRDDAWLALTASRPISAGQEITRSYEAASALSNVELLTDYGIVEAGNPMDAYMLRKGGPDILQQKSDWSTTLDEDETMLRSLTAELEGGGRSTAATDTLRTILQFRVQLKQSYPITT